MIRILNCNGKTYKKKLIDFLQIRRSEKNNNVKKIEKILKDIEKRTGSNANPISLQVIEGLNSVNKQLMKKKNLKGQEALRYFLKVALKEFNTDAPFISSLFKRYRLKERDYR